MTDDELDSCPLLSPPMVLLFADSVLVDRSFRLRSPDVVFCSAAVDAVADFLVADFRNVFDSFLRFCAVCLFGVYSVSSVSV